MLDRPRRSTRQPPRYQLIDSPPVVTRPKRKAQDTDPVEQLRFLLQNPKSVLTTIDISVSWPSDCDLRLSSSSLITNKPLNRFCLLRIS